MNKKYCDFCLDKDNCKTPEKDGMSWCSRMKWKCPNCNRIIDCGWWWCHDCKTLMPWEGNPNHKSETNNN